MFEVMNKTESFWKSFIRPFFGFIFIQPIVILWFILFSDNWWADYQSLGWTLQIVITLYLIPVYWFYEWIWNRDIEKMDLTPKWM